MVRDNIVQGVMPRSFESLERHNLVNSCLNGASEESIGMYTKSGCQWSDSSIKIELGRGRYGCLNPQRS